MPRHNLIPALFLALLLPAVSAAQGQHNLFGEYEIHHGTMRTSNLTPDVARQYDIRRSDHRGLVTVAVRRTNDSGGEPVRAKVNATAVNLSAQRRDLNMREVDEGQAIYYVDDFRIDPPETVRIEVTVTPDGSDESHELEIKRTFPAP